ncbi:ankyrin repeat domain-containing protein [uncultured Dokdonia sp.]|uniref:ankyrin repeat domain-containing protein n=1 Tax=uncultured Dokdonia sp. TaxID=575653 RepID=UPI002616CB37|nr:ankyrin repeat domain-containing protein [uncultured Dokdonia sp.]
MNKFLSIFLFLSIVTITRAQEFNKDMYLAFKNDNVSALKSHVDTSQMNECFDIKGNPYTLLAVSIKFKSAAIFKYLLSQEKVDLEQTCGGKSAIQYAAKYGHLEMLKTLIEKGAISKKAAPNGRTALDYAKKYKQQEIIDYLSSIE